MYIPHALRDTEPLLNPFAPKTAVVYPTRPDGVTELHHWPYCPCCRKPFQFEANEPFAFCDCGTSEWGDPRPAAWVPNPGLVSGPDGCDDWFKRVEPEPAKKLAKKLAKKASAKRGAGTIQSRAAYRQRGRHTFTKADVGKSVFIWRDCNGPGPYGDGRAPYKGQITAVNEVTNTCTVFSSEYGVTTPLAPARDIEFVCEDPAVQPSWWKPAGFGIGGAAGPEV